MPAKPSNSKPADVLIWNRGRTDSNGVYRVGNVVLNVQRPGTDGKPSPQIHPIGCGLDLVPGQLWADALEDAKRVEGASGSHMLTTMLSKGRLKPDVDLSKMDEAEACEAVDQTASKSILKAIAEGKIKSSAAVQEHAAERMRKWGSEENPRAMRITEHFGSYTRAG
jgi:hypothetical protein